jgi:hypothetical protein
LDSFGNIKTNNMSEKKLQSQMVLGFSQKHPDKSGDLIGTFNETISASQGTNRLSLGLVKGLSDLIYINSEKRFIAIEVKYPGTYHDLIHILEQCRFIHHNSHNGFFCKDIDSFWNIINSDGLHGGITVDAVRSWCIEAMRKKIGIFSWVCIDDLIFEANKWQKKTGKKMPKIKF